MASLEDQPKELDKLKAKGTIGGEEYETRRAAITGDATPDEKRRGGIFRWGCMGCLGMLAALVLIAVIAVVLIDAAFDPFSDFTFEDTHVAFAEGSSGTIQTHDDKSWDDVKYKLTIDKITDPAISDLEYGQPFAAYHYMTITLTIENVGEHETMERPGVEFTLRTKGGLEYDQTFVTGVGATDLDAYQGLRPGGKSTAVLAFEVPDGSVVEWLMFDPSYFEGDLYFDNE